VGRRHQPDAVGAAAALFHAGLADALVDAAAHACATVGATTVVLGGGCFFNRILSRHVHDGLAAAGLAVRRPQTVTCGDAGLALGQAWVAASALVRGGPAGPGVDGRRSEPAARPNHEETSTCA
jgi:hydrogenase maturation protein HypF